MTFLHSQWRGARREEAGQSLVEVAITLPLLLLLLGGLIDLGRTFLIYIALEDGAGEAALYAAIDPDCPYELKSLAEPTPVADNGIPNDYMGPGGHNCNPPRNAMWRAQEAGGGLVDASLVDWSDAAIITTILPTPYGIGEIVTVNIRYPVQLIMPVLPAIIGSNTLWIEAEAVQTIFEDIPGPTPAP